MSESYIKCYFSGQKKDTMTKRRVVITGLGAVTPVGKSVQGMWQAIQEGKSGIAPITLFDASNCPVKIAAEIKEFKPEEHGIDPKEARRMARFTQFLVAAANEAVKDANLTREQLAEDTTGIVAGNGLAGMDILDETYNKYIEGGKRRVSPLAMPELIANEACANVSIALGITGFAHTIATACASGTDAIGVALDAIRSGRVDVCLAGGSESGITEYSIKSFAGMHALTDKFNDAPEKASRPFDKDRSGFVMGEGGAVMVLEELEHAKARGAKIYAELAGYGASADAYHITSPRPGGETCAKAMIRAMKDADIAPTTWTTTTPTAPPPT
jgi:3-oxoacyl-(acyl-carrier-protein) synthase